jgi:tetratricopeptide (TPR) repeat protein
MQSPFMKAQRAYINGDFDTARQYLETLREQDNADIQALTLLGNTYRQLGLLNRSREVLSEALNIDPDHYFPLYGFGRTLLAEGHYAEAAQTIQSALDAGAPPAVAFDFGEAQYRAGQLDEAVQVLQAARPELRESYRILMTDYLLYRLDAGLPPAADLINAGLPYWQASAQRFQQTPYGAALAADVHALLSLLED